MSRRETLKRALRHESGPVPVDFGSTAVTGMHVTCVAALRDHYGLPRRPVRVGEPYQMLGLLEDDLLEALGVDTAGVAPRNNFFGFPNEGWKPWRAPWGQELLVPARFHVTQRGGDTYIHPEGDASAPPSGHLPDGGYFFDTIVRQEPIDEARLDPKDNVEEFQPVSDADLAYFRREVAAAAATGRGVVATFGGTAFGDIALVPAPWMKRPKGIRDIAEWYMATAVRQDYVHAVFARQLEVALANLARIRAAVGDAVDAVFVCGTDFGTQTGSFCSPATFETLWLPYYKRVNDWIHAHTAWKTFKHSCGAVGAFMDLFIRSGFDILNPVQCSAAGMDPERLKATYGDRLVFWGGGVDTQKTLPFGTPAEVREEVTRRCEIFSRRGGFVFNAVHNVQANTPVANIVAMIDAVRAFNGRA